MSVKVTKANNNSYRSIHDTTNGNISLTLDVDTVLKDYRGAPIIERRTIGDNTVTTHVTFADIVISMVNNDAEGLTGLEKFQRFNLCCKLAQGGIQQFTPEELVVIRESVGKHATPLIVGQVYALTSDTASQVTP